MKEPTENQPELIQELDAATHAIIRERFCSLKGVKIVSAVKLGGLINIRIAYRSIVSFASNGEQINNVLAELELRIKEYKYCEGLILMARQMLDDYERHYGVRPKGFLLSQGDFYRLRRSEPSGYVMQTNKSGVVEWQILDLRCYVGDLGEGEIAVVHSLGLVPKPGSFGGREADGVWIDEMGGTHE